MNAPGRTADFDRLLIALSFVLGFLALGIALAYHNIADSDLWARLAAGAAVWETGRVFESDPFAFTPTLERWIDHEWGAGVIYFGLIKLFGPTSLFVFKILSAFTALILVLVTGRQLGVRPETLLLLGLPCALAVLPGYVPVVRSHALTYMFFAFTLFALEEMRAGYRWPAFALVPLMIVWANSHGGFVSGLGTIGIYTVESLIRRRYIPLFALTLAACVAVTFINPYGFRYWQYLIPALLHDRPHIEEWQPLPLLARDSFIGFRIAFVFVVLCVAAGWKTARERLSWPGLVMLALTAYLAWSSRRHAPFFGLAALAFAGPFVESALARLPFASRMNDDVPLRPAQLVTALYVLLLLAALFIYQAGLRFHVLAPVGFYPVRESDILMYSGARGNLAVPFRWGSYALWRHYPELKVSMDGRYEETYPESTFELSRNFYRMEGPDWDRLLRDFDVHYIMVDLKTSPLRPEQLAPRGYALVYASEAGGSGLFATADRAPALRRFVEHRLPDETIEPLDAAIVNDWWSAPESAPAESPRSSR